MLKLKPILYDLPEFSDFQHEFDKSGDLRICGLGGSFLAVLLNYIREERPRPQLVVVQDSDTAEKLVDDLRSLMPQHGAVFFPADEVLPFDKGMFTPALYSQRMNSLATATEESDCILVTTAASLLRRVPSPESFKRNMLHLSQDEDFERDLLLEWLVESDYERVEIIEEIGQFSARGGIVDVFSYEAELPFRLEFFGDTIESIREFDILSQLSVNKLQRIRLLGKSPQDTQEATLFDYFRDNAILYWEDSDRCAHKMEEWWTDAFTRFEDQKSELQINEISEHYLMPEELAKKTAHFKQIHHLYIDTHKHNAFDFNIKPPDTFHGNIKLLVEYLQRNLISPVPDDRRQIIVLHDGKKSRERLEEILQEEIGFVPPVMFIDGEFHHGFRLPDHNLDILTDHEIFNRLRMRRRKRRIRVSGSLIRNLQTLEYGDYVVHIDYGVGQYQGTERIKVANMEKECIKLIYLNKDVLYVTLDKLNRIQRYVSEEGFEPKLTQLGSSEWERVKKRTKTSVEKIAKELVLLYARRMADEGHAFGADTLWQKELEASFPYEDTPDQAKAAEDVKLDMQSPKTMDRLVCGDVGYGKTEVAVRAVFKAAVDGKQVAILVPTTILAQQHFHTVRERLANFPVNVDVISRFRSRAEQKDIIDRVASGDIDVIIGTHRLLSKDVVFKDLGLLVVDEEQRFGVTHKERLKEIKVNVDTLTLTATPIPRTLHMALMGARDLSIVDTAPGNRLPILTELTGWDNELIYKAITYEMDRGGQIFFVHNRVQTIDAVANMLKNIVPKARFAVAHGQMKETELEKIMGSFFKRECDVLVATMIIENGLDIPNCNTIIINRADRFGLAQLYQLRGRVGRSDRQAYAYLIIPPQERLNDLALKRLYAMEEFGDLGSGLKIAMRDLEIRGAGNLLGHKQSGHINAVGYDLYQKILRETVEHLQEETMPDHVVEDRMPTVDAGVDIDAEMYLPDDYITAPNEKVIIYHRLLNLTELHLIDSLVEELKDRFGALPEPAIRLVEMVKIKKLASRLYIRQVKISKHKMILIFDEKACARDAFIEKELPRYINQQMAQLQFMQSEQLKASVVLKGSTPLERITFAKNFLLNL